MTFTVKYRAKNGSVAEETIEASNRSDCFAKCKSRGIAPMSVREGGAKVRSRGANSKLQTLNSKLIFFVAGIIALSVGIWFWIGEKPAKPEKVPVKKAVKKQVAKSPKDVVPATNVVKKAAAKTAAEKAEDYWEDKMYVDEKGVKRYPGGTRWLDPNRKVGVIKHPVSRMGRLFKFHSERHIAGLLELEPGTAVFGTIHYRKDLTDDFIASCKEPIQFSEDDTEEDRALKQAVEETKKDLAQRIAAGEDFVQILKEAREEAQRMGAYRSDLKKQIDEIIRDESYTDEDISDFTKAANMMLEKEGLPGLKAPHVLVRQEILRRAREQHQNSGKKEIQQ